MHFNGKKEKRRVMNETKYRYLLFAFDSHEAGGGMEDLIFKFNTLKDIVSFEYQNFYHYQLVDTSDFSFKEFTTNIVYHVGDDDIEEIIERRREEFINWLTRELV